ncbi:hypothetical protein JCM5350_004828 [Sporobolomyces pararoseus]
MPRERQKKLKKTFEAGEINDSEETSKPSLVNLSEDELAPFTLNDMGTLLDPHFEPLPEVGRLRGTRKVKMHKTLAAFAGVALESSGTLDFPTDWTTNEVMDELRKLYVEKNQTASDAEKDLGHKTQDAHRAQDIDNGMNTLRGVLNEFKNQLPPGITISKIDSCLKLLQSILRQLEGASKERKVDYFPDGQNWKLILNSFYLYSLGGMIYEARMIDQEINFTKKEHAPGSTPETMFDLINHYQAVLKGGNGENTISPRRFALRKAVCEKVREARMILHSVGVSDEVKLEKIKHARRSVIELCKEFEKVDAAILASRKNHDDRCTAHQASHQSTSRPHLPPSASLAHVPVSRRFIQ